MQPSTTDGTISATNQDCNTNFVPDECDLASGTSENCNANEIPDECESDADEDGFIDDCDGCPNDPLKSTPGTAIGQAPGQCGCGNLDTDTDGDRTADCIDGCPTDAAKIEPGGCGCFNPDTDSDFDGTPDCLDGCPSDPNKTDPGRCGCGVSETGDSDGDGVSDCNDQCIGVDDAVFGPCEPDIIPTVSQWGLAILALLLMTGAKISFRHRGGL